MIDPIELKPTSKASLFKVIRLPQGSRKQIVFRLTDQDGQPIVLTSEPVNEPADPPKFGTQKPVSARTVQIRLAAKQAYNQGARTLDIVGKVLPDCDGLVEFELSDAETDRPGVYLAEVGRFVDGDYLVDTWPVYLAIEPTIFNDHFARGPLTIPEVRLGLGDLEMGEISLLDALEFADVEILHAIRQVIDLWNETPPNVTRHTTESFPYRFHWIKGTSALLYMMAAKKYLRNQLNYSAGGVTIDDQNKYQQYAQFAQQMSEEFRDWMMKEKIRLNMALAWSNGI